MIILIYKTLKNLATSILSNKGRQLIEIHSMKKYKQVLIFIVFVVFSWVDLSAQLKTNDVVYLKNGSVIRGKILEQTTEKVKIETNCDNIFVFETAEILEIKQETRSDKTGYNENFSPGGMKGFYSYSTIGLLTGNSEVTDGFTFTFQTIGGYDFGQYLGLGAGVGIEELRTEIVPVFIQIKSNLLNRTNTPSVSFQIGYSFPLNGSKTVNYNEYKYDGGLNLGVDFGICSFRSKHRAFIISAGYHYQRLVEKIVYDYYYYWAESTVEKNTYDFNKIAIKIGFMFR